MVQCLIHYSTANTGKRQGSVHVSIHAHIHSRAQPRPNTLVCFQDTKKKSQKKKSSLCLEGAHVLAEDDKGPAHMCCGRNVPCPRQARSLPAGSHEIGRTRSPGADLESCAGIPEGEGMKGRVRRHGEDMSGQGASLVLKSHTLPGSVPQPAIVRPDKGLCSSGGTQSIPKNPSVSELNFSHGLQTSMHVKSLR